MRLLISNDDGIYAPGIATLANALKELGELTVVAPLNQQSAVGSAITLSDPIRVEKIYKDNAFFGYGIGGTPADSVKLALFALLDEAPDMVVSGINHGSNAGISILYSGTVSAAKEGAIMGIPSMAISIATFEKAQWDTAAQVAKECVQRYYKNPFPAGNLLNINVPNIPYNNIKGYCAARMSESRYEDVFHERIDPRGGTYFWMDGELKSLNDDPTLDLNALRENYVTLTPLSCDLTRHELMDHTKDLTT